MLENLINIYSLFATLTGLILCFFYYVAHVRREYQLLNGFLLGDFLSNYYWVVFVFIMGDYPNSSELMAYFGWNVGYVMLFLLALYIRDQDARNYFHPLMLIPIPLNIVQFLLYIQYGGYFNNAWQGIFCTLIAVCSLQGILFNRRRAEKNQIIILRIFCCYCMLRFNTALSRRPALPGLQSGQIPITTAM